jgi:uncharacterized protein involved in outer membrane biogenesis
MKVWKSPVFYFGIVLVLVIAGALLAPFIVDWGQYRADLQSYGQKLTGRKIEITGPISVRLFPLPRLTAGDVYIANPDGFNEKWLAKADQVTVQMTLGALLNGVIQVESIDVLKPVISLQRTQAGEGNWVFEPATAIRKSPLLEHVMLDKITLTDGVVRLTDDRHGNQFDLQNINGTLSAPNLVGPWRSVGEFTYDDLPLAFSLNTGEWRVDSPLTFGLRVASQQNSGYSYYLDGQTAGSKLTGSVRLQPVIDTAGKSDAEGQLRLVTFKSKVVATVDQIDLTDIEIRPADTRDQGTLLAGQANVVLGKTARVTADFTAPRVDLDALAGAGSRQLLRDGGGLTLVNELLTRLPKNVDLRSSLKIAALRTGGETLESVFLDTSANSDAIRIHELSASMPGRSRSLFSGVFFPGDRYAELAGNLAVESFDARQLSMWLWPDSKEDIAKTWTGIRGHLKGRTDVTFTASKLDFPNIAYELDGEPGKANFKLLVNGERPIMDVRIDTPRADIESYLSNGFTAASSQSGASWLGVLANFVAEQVKRDLRFTLQAGTLKLNGVEANDVAVDVETTVQGFDLKALEIGSVDGAKLSASGVVLSTPDGPDGQIDVSVLADDPRGLLRLGGFMPRDRDPSWSTSLGKTDLKINLKAKPSATEPATSFSVLGTVGELSIASDGSFTPAVSLADTSINGSAEIKSSSSAALANLYGAEISRTDTISAKLVVTADGSLAQDFIADVTTNIFRSNIHYAGKINPLKPAFGLNGDVTLDSADAGSLLQALQVPMPVPLGGSLSIGGKVSSSANTFSVGDIEGTFNAASFTGSLDLKDGRRLTGEINADRVSLTGLMAAVFLPWDGKVPTLEQTFSKRLPYGLEGEFWVRPKVLTVYSGLDVPDAQIGLTAANGVTTLALYGKTGTGEKVAVDLASKPAGETQSLVGQVSLPFDLAQQLKLQTGATVVSGSAGVDVKFDAKGLSPAGALASLNASGTFSLKDGRLLNLSPENFSKLIVGAKDPENLRAAFDALHQGNGIGLGSVFGSLNIVDGVAVVSPFGVTSADADSQLKTTIELATGQFNLSVDLKLKALPDLPRMAISYAGTPTQLVVNEDAAALSSFLGFKVLAQGVGDLEKLQAEQQRLAVEEEKMHKEDQEKLAAFYAQKVELRLRMRELRVQADQRALDAQLAIAAQERLILEGEAMNKLEVKQRLRELKMYRKAEATIPLQRPKLRPVQAVEQPVGPVLLVPLGSVR